MLIDSDLVIPHSTENEAFADFGLGRVAAVDFRDRRHLAAPPPASAIEIRKRHWRTGAVLNQGATSECVAYTGEQLLASSPVRNKYYKTPNELYKLCQQNDEWEGESPDYEGTSGRALFKVLREVGYIESWQNAFDLDTVVRTILTSAPVAVGTNWYMSMFYPVIHNGESFINCNPMSGIAGGHEYLIVGCNLDKRCPDGSRGAVRICNSWGVDYGDSGKVWISFTDMARLIAEGGDAIIATELKFVIEK